MRKKSKHSLLSGYWTYDIIRAGIPEIADLKATAIYSLQKDFDIFQPTPAIRKSLIRIEYPYDQAIV